MANGEVARLQACLAEIDSALWADEAVYEGAAVDTGSEDDARWHITAARKIRLAVDTAMAIAVRLDDPARPSSLQQWLRLADEYLGDAVAKAESEFSAGNFDLAFRLARHAYTRLGGEMDQWRQSLAAELAGKGSRDVGDANTNMETPAWAEVLKGRSKKDTADLLMLLQVQRDRTSEAWSLQQWAKFLVGVAGETTISETTTFRGLMLLREQNRAEHARDRRRRVKPIPDSDK
jgi:hypothetical protein